MTKYWQDEVYEHLAQLHPSEIISGIIMPAIQQVIDDYEDTLQTGFYDAETEKDKIKLTKEDIKFWKRILKEVKK